MWPRVVEFMLGLWLLLSPFIFGHATPAMRQWWISDVVCALAVCTLSALSFHRRFAGAHLLTLIVVAWLIAYAYFAGGHPSPPAAKNELVVGLLLSMTVVIPNEASLPPHEWRTA